MAEIAFLQKYQATSIKGWKEIYEHLGKILGKCEIGGKGCDDGDDHKGNYTIIQYESLTIKIYGQITEDDTLTILRKWEVSLYSRRGKLCVGKLSRITLYFVYRRKSFAMLILHTDLLLYKCKHVEANRLKSFAI